MNNIKSNQKPWKEKFAAFVEEPTRPKLRELLHREAVEDDDLEFKEDFFSYDKMARHVIAMANTRGGAIVFGVKEINLIILNRLVSNHLSILLILKKSFSFICLRL